jgi:hypothetical protein
VLVDDVQIFERAVAERRREVHVKPRARDDDRCSPFEGTEIGIDGEDR